MSQVRYIERGVVLLLNLRIQNGIFWLVVLTGLKCEFQTVLRQSCPESMSSQNSLSLRHVLRLEISPRRFSLLVKAYKSSDLNMQLK